MKKLLANLTIDKDRRQFEPAVVPCGRIKYLSVLYSTNRNAFMILNFFMLLFTIPLIALVLVVKPMLEEPILAKYNFIGTLGFGYPGITGNVGACMQELYMEYFRLALMLAPCFLLVFVMSSGMFYVSRNIDWRVPVKKPVRAFFKGIKTFALSFLLVGVIVTALGIGYCAVLFWHLSLYAVGSATVLSWFAVILSSLILLFVVIMLVILLPMLCAYRFRIKDMLKNSFILTLSFITTSIIVGGLVVGIVYAGLFTSNIFQFLFILVLVMFGFSYVALMWTVYAHYVFDATINRLYTESMTPKNQGSKNKKQAQKSTNNYAKNYKSKAKAKVAPASDGTIDMTDTYKDDTAEIKVVGGGKK